MNKTKLLLIAVIALLLLNIGTLSFILLHKRPMPDGMRNGEGPKQIIIERLHFDGQQQTQYSAIVEEHRSKSRELNDLSRNLHNQLYAFLSEKDIEKTKADSLITRIAENQKAIDNLNLDHFQKIKRICKDNQLQFFDNLVKDLGHLFAPHHPPKK